MPARRDATLLRMAAIDAVFDIGPATNAERLQLALECSIEGGAPR